MYDGHTGKVGIATHINDWPDRRATRTLTGITDPANDAPQGGQASRSRQGNYGRAAQDTFATDWCEEGGCQEGADEDKRRRRSFMTSPRTVVIRHPRRTSIRPWIQAKTFADTRSLQELIVFAVKTLAPSADLRLSLDRFVL